MLRRVGFVLFFSLGVGLLLVHTYAWLTPNDVFYLTIPFFDKIEHFWSGIVLAGLLLTARETTSPIVVFFIVLVLGVIWELIETETGFDAKSDIAPDIVLNQVGCLVCSSFVLWSRR